MTIEVFLSDLNHGVFDFHHCQRGANWVGGPLEGPDGYRTLAGLQEVCVHDILLSRLGIAG